MNYTFQPGFPRRRNDDGTYDSMCLECLQMVASQCAVAQLTRLEESHVCKARRTSYQRVPSSLPAIWRNTPRDLGADVR